MREKIIQVAQELGYFYNTGITNIGLVFKSFRNHFQDGYYNEIIMCILERASELNLNVRILEGLDIENYEKIYDINGYLIIGNDSAVHIADVEKTQQPFLLVGCTKNGTEKYHRIYADPYQGIVELTEFVCNCRHRRITVINAEPDSLDFTWLRFKKGLDDGLSRCGLSADVLKIVSASHQNIETAEIILNKILSMKPRPTCIICINDRFAYQLYKLLRHYGLQVPRDISLTGSDGLALPGLEFELSTVVDDRQVMGRQAMDFLLSILNNEKGLKKDIILNKKFKVGQSVRRLNK
ncbi:transcriptional regulators LacI family [Candidatus Termititenax persephonae]|uniref:Transcriptional regulators LacI family n=1 Tax=Candidatus Termititenax persephonae TaxID=2218525 RepID=A0A388TFX5_9BACT|nr:transcriptional regulators LacI family [Candidatus Termititenax persephonae]